MNGGERAVDGAVAASSGSVGYDRALIARSVAGDLDAYDQLLEPRLGQLYYTALGIMRNEADARDALQDASFAAWRQLKSLRETDRFDAWLGRILVNTCRSALRVRGRVQVREIDMAANDPSAASPATEIAERDAVRRAFLRLKPDERIILGLHHADQRSIEEIGDLLGIPEGTVKWRLHAARQSLAKALERER